MTDLRTARHGTLNRFAISTNDTCLAVQMLTVCLFTASTATSQPTLAANTPLVTTTPGNATAPRDLAVMTAYNPVRIPSNTIRSFCRVANRLSTVCGSLGHGQDRPIRDGPSCQCDEGWTGINCNVCTEDKACDALMQTGDGGVCYQRGEVVNHNFQMCDVTNKAIRDLLKTQIPQVTFTCKKEDRKCDFQCTCPLPIFRRSLPATAILTSSSSLGRPARVLHVPPRGLRVQRRTQRPKEQHLVQVQDRRLRMHPRPHVVW